MSKQEKKQQEAAVEERPVEETAPQAEDQSLPQTEEAEASPPPEELEGLRKALEEHDSPDEQYQRLGLV